jgi:hypothetical protein
MESQKKCPECQGTMVLTSGVGGLFWRRQKCGKKLQFTSGDIKDYEDHVKQ